MGRVSKMAEWVEVPGEPGNEFQMRPLSDPELTEAEDASTSRGADALKLMSQIDPQVLKEWQSEDEEEDPLRGLDTSIVLKYGLLDCRGPDYNDGLAEIVADLDAATSRWAARWIAGRSRRSSGEGKGSSTTSSMVESPPS